MFTVRSSGGGIVKGRRRTSLRAALAASDRRSIGGADAVAAVITDDVRRFGEAFALICDADPLVRLPAADAVEKASRLRPALLAPHKTALLGLLAGETDHQVRWHVLQMVPRLDLSDDERRAVCALVERSLLSASGIEAVEALSAMFALGVSDAVIRADAEAAARRLLAASAPAVRARARRLLKGRLA